MTERASLPGLRGYEFDEDVAMPRASADYDLFGMSLKADMLRLDRISETVHLGGAALFPEREYIISADAIQDFDPLGTNEATRDARKDTDA